MKKDLSEIVLFVCFFFCCFPAIGQRSVQDQLWTAVSEGNSEAIQPLIEKGANVNDVRGEGEYRYTLLDQAIEHNRVYIVELLLEKGASIEATSSATTSAPLWSAACLQNQFQAPLTPRQKMYLVKLLLDKGANPNIRVNLVAGNPLVSASLLDCANLHGPPELIDLLEQILIQGKKPDLSIDPGEKLAVYLSTLEEHPKDGILREKVIAFAGTLPELPPIPEAARQLFVLASGQIKQAKTPEALDQPIVLLRKATDLAPWWANAYYNLSRALEMSGQYDDAIQQLKYYLELKPAEADARETQTHIVVIQTEKEAAAHKQQ